jgi:hypothetical protein
MSFIPYNPLIILIILVVFLELEIILILTIRNLIRKNMDANKDEDIEQLIKNEVKI